jgi:hypothetical protein
MRNWLRLALILMTVGGGFAGFVGTFMSFSGSPGEGILATILRAIFLALYAFIATSGLIFVHNPQKIRPLAVALAMQVPSFSSPLFVYKLVAGSAVVAGVGSPTKPGKILALDGQLFLGSTWGFEILQGDRWALSLNLVALALLILLWRSRQGKGSVVPEDK